MRYHRKGLNHSRKTRMAKNHQDKRRDGVSPQTDELASTLLGDALDLLAAGEDLGVLLVIGDDAGHVASYRFADDGEEQLLEGARDRVAAVERAHGDREAELGEPVRYSLAYEGAVADEAGVYQDALLFEFGEKGYKAYSAYSYVKGKGTGDRFQWTDAAPAGEVEPLL